MSKNWTWNDYDIIYNKYPEFGKDVKYFIKDRSPSALQSKAEKLGVSYNVPFTNSELALVAKYKNDLGDALIFLLPDRTVNELREVMRA